MATYTYTGPSRTLTVVLTDAEAKVLVRAVQLFGNRVLQNHIDAWFTLQANKFDETDKTTFRSALANATPAQIDQIKGILGL